MTEYKSNPILYKSEYKTPIWETFTSPWAETIAKMSDAIICKACCDVGIHVDKERLERALVFDSQQYSNGEWDMFNLITSVWNGKQAYFLQEDGRTVYSRNTGKYMTKDEAYTEFLNQIGE